MGFICCGRPSGNSIFVPMIFTTCAFFLSNRGSRWCDFLVRNSTTNGTVSLITDADLIFSVSRTLGPWGYEDIIQSSKSNLLYCYSFSETFIDNELDTKWRSAMAFPVVTSIIGGVIMIVMWFAPCMGIAQRWWRLMGLGLLLTCLFEGLTFLMLASDVCKADYRGSTDDWYSTPACSLARGGNCAIAATVFWFIAAVSVTKVPPPTPVDQEPVVVQQTTTTTKTTQPDGTEVIETKTETVAVNA